MSNHNDVSEHSTPALIRRCPSVLNLRKLLNHTKSSCDKRHSESLAASRLENHHSEEGDILYLAVPKKSTRKSLSALSNQSENRSDRPLDGSTDEPGVEAKFVEDAHEQLSYSIINREISDWQHMCRTGRPLWWIPESICDMSQNQNPWPPDEPQSIWYSKHLGCRTDHVYHKKRRAASKNYLNNPNEPDELAHLVAIQLLSSCFTLPPNSITSIPAPDFAHTEPNLPDPRLISSLRMHTQFRYSPCFGHQPRNSSPASSNSLFYDGQAHMASLPNTGIQTPVIGTSASVYGREKAHRHHVSEGSAAQMKRKREDVIHKHRRAARNQHFSQDSSVRNYQEVGNLYSPSARNLNYRLEPVLRSEPHPVFIQPVKELVVKRRSSLRRRFEGSLNGALRSHASEDVSMTSESGPSGATTSGMSSEARVRRLRAQERGEIHSNSDIESTQHHSTPILGPYEAITTSHFLAESPLASTGFQHSDIIASAAFLGIGDRTIVANPAEIRRPAAPKLAPLPTGRQLSHNLANQNDNAEELSPLMLPKPIVSIPSPQYYRDQRMKDGRKGKLSEMHPPEGFAGYGDGTESSHVDRERNVLSAAGSELNSPSMSLPASSTSITGDIGYFNDTANKEIPRRPRMKRMSTNGTQVFSPGDEGVELDGLPVGPSRHVWNGEGKSRERSYL